MKLSKGHEFYGPHGQGYRLTRDVQTGDVIMAVDFEAFGGAPEPQPRHAMPEWLAKMVERVGRDVPVVRTA